jgi:hypothetical protein
MPKKIMILTSLLVLGLLILVGCTWGPTTPKKSDQQPVKSKTAVKADNQLDKPTTAEKATESSKSDKSAGKAQINLLQGIKLLADQGRIINSEFPVRATVIETVKNKWGVPDKEEYIAAAKGTYVTYAKQKAVFGFNKGSQIFDVRSYDTRLSQITMSDVKNVLGQPDNIHHYNTEDMLVYNLGDDYQLLFIFPEATQQNPNPVLNHYNVFYPDGSVNSMADDPGLKY